MIETIVELLTGMIESVGYVGVALAMFIESFFAPIPSEFIMPFAGFIAADGTMSLLILTLVGGFASYLGSLPFYFLGYWGNDVVMNKFLSKYGKYLFIRQQDVDKGFEIFDKYGNGIVMVGRIIPIIRTVISFPAGLAKMKFVEFSLYTIVGSVVWSGFLASMGYVLGDRWEIVIEWMSKYEKAILIIGVIAVIAYIVRGVVLKKKSK